MIEPNLPNARAAVHPGRFAGSLLTAVGVALLIFSSALFLGQGPAAGRQRQCSTDVHRPAATVLLIASGLPSTADTRLLRLGSKPVDPTWHPSRLSQQAWLRPSTPAPSQSAPSSLAQRPVDARAADAFLLHPQAASVPPARAADRCFRGGHPGGCRNERIAGLPHYSSTERWSRWRGTFERHRPWELFSHTSRAARPPSLAG
jgi:hypothetical protein